MLSLQLRLLITVLVCFGNSRQTLSLALGSSGGGTVEPAVAPEIPPSRIRDVSNLVSRALGDLEFTNDVADGCRDAERRNAVTMSKDRRYDTARTMAGELGVTSHPSSNSGPSRTSIMPPPPHELVYGELSVPVLATILDAVGVRHGERFLDVGSGDGALVLGASLLCVAGLETGMNAITKARGVEIVPGLIARSKVHARRMCSILESLETEKVSDGSLRVGSMASVEFLHKDIHMAQTDSETAELLADTSLALCFATTWSAGNVEVDPDGGVISTGTLGRRRKTSLQGRALPKLSLALSLLPTAARVVVVDGTLDVRDGFKWQGDLRIKCPDTAPYSIATLYERK